MDMYFSYRVTDYKDKKCLDCGLLVDYCDVFISCLDSHSDGTHSLQSIHCWASVVMLHFSRSVLMNYWLNYSIKSVSLWHWPYAIQQVLSSQYLWNRFSFFIHFCVTLFKRMRHLLPSHQRMKALQVWKNIRMSTNERISIFSWTTVSL